jgi:hypothetical protein
MAMKKREALDGVVRMLKDAATSGTTRVGFLTEPPKPAVAVRGALPIPDRQPEFEFSGWQFFAINSAFDDELNEGGNAFLRAPDGTFVHLVWAATGSLTHRFNPDSGPMMLYVEVPAPVAAWDELRPHFEFLAPALERDLKDHRPSNQRLERP